jgi:drug/metabolite transporter (DMT)-like permease
MILSTLVFKEKITTQKICALLIAFAGCVLTIGIDRIDVPVIGIVTGIAAAFFFSLFTIFGKLALRKYDPITVSVYPYITASVILLPLCDFGNVISVLSADSINLVYLATMAIFITMIPTICYKKGLEGLEPGKVSIISFIEPLTAAVVGVILFSEMLSATRISGIALIFFALIILNLNRRKPLDVSS